jgi:23S rRNA (guanine745-N1)-methyltransferase
VLADIVEFLVCPVCREAVALEGGPLRCARGHTFDVARQGYVSLLVGSRVPGTADSPEMVAARAAFLGAGHFAPLTEALAETVARAVTPPPAPASAPAPDAPAAAAGKARIQWSSGAQVNGIRGERFREAPDGAAPRAYGGACSGGGAGPEGLGAGSGTRPVIVDAGTGTGHYLAAVLQAVDHGIGVAFDVSKHAVRRAARAHPRLGAFVADVWQPLPLRSGVADVVMDVFAPRNGPEFRRVLRPGGAVVVVTPARSHLSPLVEELGLLSVDDDKERRVARSMEGFCEVERRTIEFDMELSPREVVEVAKMGPSAWHTRAAALDERITAYISRAPKKQVKVVTRAAFQLSVFETSP